MINTNTQESITTLNFDILNLNNTFNNLKINDDGVIIEFVPKFNQVSSRIFTSTLVLPYDNLHDTNFANGTTRNKDIQLNDDFIES